MKKEIAEKVTVSPVKISLSEDFVALQRQNDALVKKAASLTEDLRGSRQQLADVNEKLAARDAHVAILEQKVVKSTEVIAAMELQLESTISREDFAGLQVEQQRASDDSRRATQEVADVKQSLAAATRKLAEMVKDRAAADAERNVMEEKLESAVRSNIDELLSVTRQRDETVKQLEQVRLQLQEKDAEINGLQAALRQRELDLAAKQQQLETVRSRSATPVVSLDELARIKLELEAQQVQNGELLKAKTKNEQLLNKRISALEQEMETRLADVSNKEQGRSKILLQELEQANKVIASLKQELSTFTAANVVASTPTVVRQQPLPVAAPLPDPMPDLKTDTPEVTQLKKTVRDNFVPASRLFQLKCDSDKLRDEVRRLQTLVKNSEQETKDDLTRAENKIKQLQTENTELRQSRTKLLATQSRTDRSDSPAALPSKGDTAVPSAGNQQLEAIRLSNTKLIADREALNLRVGTLEAELATLRSAGSLTSASLAGRLSSPMYQPDRLIVEKDQEIAHLKASLEELRVTMVQTERRQLDQQELNKRTASTFSLAMDKGDQDAAKLRERVQQLEGEITSLKALQEATNTAAVKKVVRKKKGSASLLGDDHAAAEMDRRPPTPPPVVSPADASMLELFKEQIEEATTKLEYLQREILILQKENLRQKETITTLTAELATVNKGAADDRESLEDEVADLKATIQNLKSEAKLVRRSSTPPAVTLQTDQRSSLPEDAARIAKLQKENEDLQSKLRESEKAVSALHEAVGNLETELEEAQHESARLQSTAGTAVFSPKEGDSEPTDRMVKELEERVEELEIELRQRDEADLKRVLTEQATPSRVAQAEKETNRLARELAPLKARIAEQSAVLDRLGIPYPFPEEFERVAKLRLAQLRPDEGSTAGGASMAGRGRGRARGGRSILDD